MNPDWLIQEEQRLKLVKKLSATHLNGEACVMRAGGDLGRLDSHRLQRHRQYVAGLAILIPKQVFEEMFEVILLHVSCNSIVNSDRRGKYPDNS
jgi:hypothetical protein